MFTIPKILSRVGRGAPNNSIQVSLYLFVCRRHHINIYIYMYVYCVCLAKPVATNTVDHILQFNFLNVFFLCWRLAAIYVRVYGLGEKRVVGKGFCTFTKDKLWPCRGGCTTSRRGCGTSSRFVGLASLAALLEFMRVSLCTLLNVCCVCVVLHATGFEHFEYCVRWRDNS